MSARAVDRADDLRAMAAEPGITRAAICERLGVSQAYLCTLLNRAGVSMPRDYRRSDRPKTRREERDLEQNRKIPPARGRQHRHCITCGSGFWSEGPGNRMCDRCRLEPSEDWL